MVNWNLLASKPSRAIAKGVTVEAVKARCHNCSSKLCLPFDPFLLESPTAKAAAQHLQPYCRCIASSAVNRLGRKKQFAAPDAA